MFALINGGGGSAWDWHLVAPELPERGHAGNGHTPPEDLR
jgi:hypothetical protein